jgi:hypothetical protein
MKTFSWSLFIVIVACLVDNILFVYSQGQLVVDNHTQGISIRWGVYAVNICTFAAVVVEKFYKGR